jgi:hypothetical protein
MPRYDAHHDVVKTALVKDGWTITHDPFIISIGRRRMLADLGAEKASYAIRQDEKIVIEIKVLGGDSLINDLHRAIGQYQNYRSLLRHLKSERKLYLAIPLNVYEKEMGDEMIQTIISDQQILLLVFDPEKEEIVQWINSIN